MTTGEEKSVVLAQTQKFIGALKATPAGQALLRALERTQGDPEVQRLHENLQRAVDAFQRAQQAGTVSEEQIQAIREAQAEYQRHPTVGELFGAQMKMTSLLRSANFVISDLLALDFGQTVRSAGGCC
jgi:cell fate (sporulation/competence/biofilm development) regulator YlbF (YheA/YmcA/DUF963 family)